ncbi:MAG: tetratricopeptide repeat protein, partial [Candidatus Marinimicrobia bacterium]|nr:tetratricopeptide repeat protein [Candidatus Neomarinimicrobiota bacterium]
MSELNEAHEAYGLGHKIAKEKLNKNFIAKFLSGLGIVAFSEGRLEEARVSFESALEEQGNIKDTFGEGLTLNNLGLLLFQKNDFPSSIEYFEESIKRSDQA